EHEAFAWDKKRLRFEEEQWSACEFVCFATPIHGRWGNDRRIIYPEQAHRRLTFWADRASEGSEFDDWDHESFINVRFYKRELSGEPSSTETTAADNVADVPRRNWTVEQIREVARAVYDESPDDPPNLKEAEPLIRERLPGAVRTRIRPVLAEFEF